MHVLGHGAAEGRAAGNAPSRPPEQITRWAQARAMHGRQRGQGLVFGAICLQAPGLPGLGLQLQGWLASAIHPPLRPDAAPRFQLPPGARGARRCTSSRQPLHLQQAPAASLEEDGCEAHAHDNEEETHRLAGQARRQRHDLRVGEGGSRRCVSSSTLVRFTQWHQLRN